MDMPKTKTPRDNSILLVLVVSLIALIVRVIYVRTLGDSFRLNDEYLYDTLAANLAAGKGFSGDYGSGIIGPTALKFPGLPAIMALVYSTVGRHLYAVRLLQALFGAMLVPIAFAITRQLGYSRRAAMLACVGAAIYPYYVFSAGAVYPVVTTALLVAGATLLLLRSRHTSGIVQEVAAGVLFGLSLLVFGHVALALPLVAVWVVLNKQAERRRRWVAGMAVVFAAGAVILPWMIRNKIELGRFGLSTALEMNLYLGNAKGVHWDTGSKIIEFADPEVMLRVRSLGETEAAQVYWQEFVKRVKEDPGRFVVLSLGKAANVWRFYPNLATRPITMKEKAVGILSYGSVMVLGLLWFVVDKPRRRTNALMMIYFVATMIPCAVSCSQDRYRMPFDVYLIILASAALVTWLERGKARNA